MGSVGGGIDVVDAPLVDEEAVVYSNLTVDPVVTAAAELVAFGSVTYP